MKEILREVGMIARCFESIANIEFKDYNLSKNQYIYLVRIAEHPGIILEELCDLVKVDRSTASRAVKKLEQYGFVKKVDDRGTGKRIKLYTTHKGEIVFEMLQNDEDYSNRIALDGFSPVEMNLLLGYLKRIRMNVEKDWNDVKKGKERPYLRTRLNDQGEIVEDITQVVAYEDQDLEGFRAVNYQWLNAYVSVEEADERILGDPQGQVIDRGGHIFVAKQGEDVIGTIALMKVDHKTYEIGKLGVLEGYREKGIGRQLMVTAIMKAYTSGAEQVVLYTAKKLKAALALYDKLGFVEVVDENQKYEDADTKMILQL